jgi:hypothetical protein
MLIYYQNTHQMVGFEYIYFLCITVIDFGYAPSRCDEVSVIFMKNNDIFSLLLEPFMFVLPRIDRFHLPSIGDVGHVSPNLCQLVFIMSMYRQNSTF